MIRRCFLSAKPVCLRYLTKCKPYSWKHDFVIYPFGVAAIFISPGAFNFHVSLTRTPLGSTMGGTTFPAVLMKDKMIDVSPCLAETCWKQRMFFNPNTFTSFGTFCTPILSPDQIWSGDVMPAVFFILSRSVNQDLITVGFVPMARVIDKLRAFFNVICGCRDRNPCNHFHPANCVSSLNPCIPFTCAYWNASSHTRTIVNGNPLSWNLSIVWARLCSSAGKFNVSHNLGMHRVNLI